MSQLNNVSIQELKVNASMLQVRVLDENGFPSTVRLYLTKGPKGQKEAKTLEQIQEDLVNGNFPVKATEDVNGKIKFDIDEEKTQAPINVYTASDNYGGTYATFLEPYVWIEYPFNDMSLSFIGRTVPAYVKAFIDEEWSLVIEFSSKQGEKFGKRFKLASIVNGKPMPNIVQIDGRSAKPWFEAFGVEDALEFVKTKSTFEGDLNIVVNGNQDKTKTWLAPTKPVTDF